MKKKKYKDMTPEEQYEEDLRLARKWSRESIYLAITALVVNVLIAILKSLGKL